MRLLLLAAFAAFASAQTVPYSPPSQLQRLKWATLSSVGPPSLAAGVFTAAISTAENNPREYGPHWDGYAKRQGLRLTGAVTSSFMEAELGALWHEDPRYRRSNQKGVGNRIWYAVKTSVLAYDREGHVMPAYSRLIAIPTSNVIANSWRPDSQHTAGQTTARISLGFVSRIAANTFAEFWPDLSRKLRKK